MDEVKILVVEDNKEDLAALEKILKELGYKLWSTDCGEEALKIIKQNSMDLIITELHMPGMNGTDITRAALKINPNISVVVITAYSFISLAVEAMEEGAYGYVTKPFNLSEIRIALERAIERFYLLSSDRKKEYYAELSVKDALTGVYNRRYLRMYISQQIEMTNRASEKFSILMIDIDYFKKYNDTNGHLAGDKLLRKVCEVFAESVRDDDILFRYGGEEFVVFLAYADKVDASLVAERIRASINLFMPVTVSIGIGTYPDDGLELEALIMNVDAALYRAKEKGRNTVCLV